MHKTWIALIGVVLAGAALLAGAAEDPLAGWTHDFAAEREYLTCVGDNPFFRLEPGYRLVLSDGDAELAITVTEQRQPVDGVQCAVVEELETEGDAIVERSLNYFAHSRRTGSVFYFGEDTGGAWRSGVDGARFGLMMPGLPLVGARFYEEIAPGVAMDRAEVVAADETVSTPAGTFRGCLVMRETTPLEPDANELKYYAPGVGLVREGDLRLVRVERDDDDRGPRRRH